MFCSCQTRCHRPGPCGGLALERDYRFLRLHPTPPPLSHPFYIFPSPLRRSSRQEHLERGQGARSLISPVLDNAIASTCIHSVSYQVRRGHLSVAALPSANHNHSSRSPQTCKHSYRLSPVSTAICVSKCPCGTLVKELRAGISNAPWIGRLRYLVVGLRFEIVSEAFLSL